MMFPVIGAIIESIAAFVPKVIEIVGVNLLQFANILSDIFKGLGILSPNEESIDLGDKALQAEEQGIKPENYDNYSEYLEVVRAFEVDADKSAAIDETKKIKKGVEIITATLVENYGDVIMDFIRLIAKHPPYFEERIPYFTEMQKTDPKTFSDITRYIEGKETDMNKADETLSKMYDVEKKIDENTSLQDMMAEIEKLQD